MENLLRLSYREDLDMPEFIKKETYRKLRFNIDRRIRRINKLVKKVEDATGENSGISLEFCLTGYNPRGGHFVCAVWPRNPSRVRYYSSEELDEQPSVDDPLSFHFSLGSNHNAGSFYYLFFSENPHQSHRPYLLSNRDKLFTRQDQDDKKAIEHNLKKVLVAYEEKMHSVEQVIASLKSGDLSLDAIAKAYEEIRFI